jgi:hypothetical protein
MNDAKYIGLDVHKESIRTNLARSRGLGSKKNSGRRRSVFSFAFAHGLQNMHFKQADSVTVFQQVKRPTVPA